VRAAKAGTDLLLYSNLGRAAHASRALRRTIARGALRHSKAAAMRVLTLRRGL
jgi:hypothetical protein